MTILRGKVTPTSGLPTEGTVTVWSPRFRPGSDSAISTERHQEPIVSGAFKIEVEPGETVFTFTGVNGETSTLETTVPSVDELDLLDLMEGDFEYEPPVVQAAQQAARDARADRVESQRIATAFGGIERVEDLEKSAQISAKAAEDHRKASKASEEEADRQATRSEQEADRSAGQARASANSAGDADASAKAAADSEDEAGKAQVAADGHEKAARGYSVTAEQHRDDADGHRHAAATSEANAKTSETNAGKSASDAQQSAESADRTVRAAVTEVTGITEGHKNDAEKAAGNAASSASEGRGYRDDARTAAAQAEEIATGNLPDASATTRGLVTMTGDLSGTGDNPTVPALSLAAPGASVCVTPPSEGWANATAPAASTPTGWGFDGEWLSPPRWLSSVHVTVDWCGGSSAVLRGRRPDGNASTLATVPEGTPETHRSVTVLVDLEATPTLAVGGQWTPEDVEAGCTASLIVRPLPEHQHSIDDVANLRAELRNKVDETDRRLDDPRKPLAHQHSTSDVTGLDTMLDERPTRSEVQARPAMWLWSGIGEWVAPEGAVATDSVLNLDTSELHTIEEVSNA